MGREHPAWYFGFYGYFLSFQSSYDANNKFKIFGENRMKKWITQLLVSAILAAFAAVSASAGDAAYGKGSRTDKNGWIFLHVEGSPSKRGEQHGYLVAAEIADLIETLKAYVSNSGSPKSWEDFRKASSDILLPKIEKEYVDELKGILKGMGKAGVQSYDLTDLVTMNAVAELETYFEATATEAAPYTRIFRRIPGAAPDASDLTHCSAFIATGSATKDGRIVLAHNTWSYYLLTQRFNVIIDIKPSKGARILMQCSPGYIHSSTDFAISSYGLVISETTIARATGFDTDGIPEFVRMRKAAQYAKTIDDFYTIIKTGNNGGYANTWLVGDTTTNEIAKIELGLKNVAFYRSMDGYYDGVNYVDDSKMIRDECGPSLWDMLSGTWPRKLAGGNACSARRLRWFSLLDQNKGLVDAENSKEFLADQIDPLTGQFSPGEKVLMCRMEIQLPPWNLPYGAGDGKVVTSELADKMSFWARMDHPDGSTYSWDQFFVDNPQYAWQKPYLRELRDNPWTLFQSTTK